MHSFKLIRKERNQLHSEIRNLKSNLKGLPNGELWEKQSKLRILSTKARLMHIAFCELRDKTRDEIEPIVYESNSLSYVTLSMKSLEPYFKEKYPDKHYLWAEDIINDYKEYFKELIRKAKSGKEDVLVSW